MMFEKETMAVVAAFTAKARRSLVGRPGESIDDETLRDIVGQVVVDMDLYRDGAFTIDDWPT